MSKVKVKSKIKKTIIGDFSVDEILKRIVGDPNTPDDIELIKIRNKDFTDGVYGYIEIRIKNFTKYFSNKFNVVYARCLNDNQDMLNKFVEYRNMIKSLEPFTINFSWQNPETIDKEIIQKILEYKNYYFKFKESELVSDCIAVCNNLVNDGIHTLTSLKPNRNEENLIKEIVDKTKDEIKPLYEDKNIQYQKYLEEIKKGKVTKIMPFHNIIKYENNILNIMDIINNTDINEEDKIELIDILVKLFLKSYKVYELYNKPDIDIDQLFPTLMSQFEELTKEVKGCKKAKKIIKNSSNIFKENFQKYFKNFKTNNSRTSILEDFLTDVTDKFEGDTSLLNEIKTLITHFKKKMTNNQAAMNNNPKMKNIINILDTLQEKILQYENSDDTEFDEDDKKEKLENFISNFLPDNFKNEE